MQLRAEKWDTVWQRDNAGLPRLYQVLHACRAEAAMAEHARPTISDGALARAVALLRNKREVSTDNWTLVELKALPDVTTASLAFIVRQINVGLMIPLQCLTNLMCLLPKPRGGERPIVFQSLPHVLWSSCSADAMRREGCSALQLAIRRRPLQEVEVILGESTASVCWDLQKFCDSIDVRHLLRLSVPMGVAVVDLQVHLGLRALRCAGAFAKPQIVANR